MRSTGFLFGSNQFDLLLVEIYPQAVLIQVPEAKYILVIGRIQSS